MWSGRPKETPIKRFFSTLTLIGAVTACGVTGPTGNPGPGPTPGPVTPSPNTLTGRILNAAGQPVADAEVWIQPVSYAGLIKARTDAQGYYRSTELNAAVAPYKAQAYKMIDYHGEMTCVRMGGETSQDFDVFNPKAGAVRNFRWKMTGPAEGGYDNQRWGGDLRFYRDPETSPEDFVGWDETIEVKLVPNGPLIDGSEGQELNYSVPAGAGIPDVPVGRYDVTAVVVKTDGTRTPLRLKADNDVQTGDFGTSITVLFDGPASCGHYATYHSTPLALSR